MNKITVELTEDQRKDLVLILDRAVEQCDYYIKRYDGQVGTQVTSKRLERAFIMRLRTKLAKAKNS